MEKIPLRDPPYQRDFSSVMRREITKHCFLVCLAPEPVGSQGFSSFLVHGGEEKEKVEVDRRGLRWNVRGLGWSVKG